MVLIDSDFQVPNLALVRGSATYLPTRSAYDTMRQKLNDFEAAGASQR